MPRSMPSIVVCIALLAGSVSNGDQMASPSSCQPTDIDSSVAPDYLLVKIRMVEVNRTKMHKLGIDFARADDQTGGPKPGEPLFEQDTPPEFVVALEKHNIAKEISSANIGLRPDGKPVSFLQGGTIEVPLESGQSKKVRFGTEVKVMADLLQNSTVKLHLSYRFSDLASDQEIAPNAKLPGTSIQTVVTSDIGQTIYLGGMHVREQQIGEERELLLMVTTEAADNLARSPEPTSVR